ESWDAETEAPAKSVESRADAVGTLSEMSYEISTAPKLQEAVETLYANRKELSPVLSHEIENQHKEIAKLARIPQEEYVEYSKLMSLAYPRYVEAKRNNDWASWEPILAKIVDYARKYMVWQDGERHGYDILLDDYEPGYGMAEYDRFFDLLKERLVPLVHKIGSKGNADVWKPTGKYPVDKQKAYCEEYLRKVMCFDPSETVVKESEHPFTNGFGRLDVRITNHYYEEDPASAIFSAIHEMGHGMYERQCDPSLDDTMSGGGASMAMHESQSRLMENVIGRSPEFWTKHYPKLQRTFRKQLGEVSLADWCRYINRVECSLIRTEADELTYPLHIMVRYELEKALMNGSLEVRDLPAAWNAKYKEYLGVDVPSDALGVLQDVHWAGGSFGYFPTYALGSAYASQMVHAMCKDLDWDAAVSAPTLKTVAAWLKRKVHRYGSSKEPKDILMLATGEAFNPEYYVEYLLDKYSKIYGAER
ncbi:MAG: carboxypeptidase M32, partial [Clostridia bacterium]|nr:carboxypeptidase M32 [Clostridia bacterium]